MTLPALVLGSLARTVGLLLLRRLREARDEAAALGGVLRRPGRLRRARRRRRQLATAPASHVRPVLASRVARLRGRAESFGGWLAGGGTPARGPAAGLREPGGGSDDELEPVAPGLARSLLARPPVVLVLGLLLVALLAERDLLPSAGLLAGGRLLPPPSGAADLWDAYTASWSAVGVGTDAPSPPRVAVLAGLSTVLLGKPWLAVDLLLLGSVPLAGLTAYLAARRVVTSAALGVWAAATWALLPAATGAIAAGRLDAAFAQVVLPLLLPALAATARTDPRGRWHRVPAAGLLLALTTALAPTLWLVAAPLLVLVGLAGLAGASRAQRPAAARRATASVVVAALPVLLLVPWPREVLRSPGLLLHGPGALPPDPSLLEPDLAAWRLLLLDPGGAATPLPLVTAGLLLAALAGLVRSDRRRPALAGWGLALTGLTLAVVLARTAVPLAVGGVDVPVWPGLALQVAAAGLLLAALVAGDGARRALSRRDFGWRQVTASLTAAAAVLVPIAAGALWVVRAADDPLGRGVDDVVPAFVAAELEGEPGVRALVLDARADGTVGYELWTAGGVRLGTADLPLADDQAGALDDVVADLLSARGSRAAEALATRAVRYVVLPADALETEPGSAVAAALDRQPGVVRRAEDPALLWQLQPPTAHLAVLAPELAEQAVTGAPGPDEDAVETTPPVALPSGPRAATARVPDGEPGRLLVLAEAVDDGWRATLDGRRLVPVAAWGWAQGFELPAGGGRLELRHEDGTRTRALTLQGAALALTAVLAVPAGRRRSGLEPADVTEPAVRS
ncbi:MAG TPA: hypothetical protein VNU26_18715 [Mycobacteriales bacterium]|nr:hypothetical protein [Mycobacteriales bacterium]